MFYFFSVVEFEFANLFEVLFYHLLLTRIPQLLPHLFKLRTRKFKFQPNLSLNLLRYQIRPFLYPPRLILQISHFRINLYQVQTLILLQDILLLLPNQILKILRLHLPSLHLLIQQLSNSLQFRDDLRVLYFILSFSISVLLVDSQFDLVYVFSQLRNCVIRGLHKLTD